MGGAWELGRDGGANAADVSPQKNPDASILRSAFSKAQFKAENAKKVKEYFTSDVFISQLESAVTLQAQRRPKSYCNVSLIWLGDNFKTDAKRDGAYVQEAFEKFKIKHPELDLNHIRFRGKAALVLDTKPNSFVRRHLTARGWPSL